MRKILTLCICLVLIPLVLQVSAEEEEGVYKETAEAESLLLTPKESKGALYSDSEGGSGMMVAIYLFLFMAFVLVGLWLWSKKRGLPIKGVGGSGQNLHIKETKALGNRQYLMVVGYGGQKMLLGVTQGSINHLCYLDDETNVGDEEFSER